MKSKRQQEFGAYVQELKKKHRLAIKEVVEKIGVTINFITWTKTPSDQIIKKYSTLFCISIIELYLMLDKIPPYIKETNY